MNRFLALTTLALVVAAAAYAVEWPYNERADAQADVKHALAAAQAQHKKVLLVFGANWCQDCRDLDKALHGSSRPLIEGKFEVVKIDVGNFDKNLALAQRYGNPIKMGIPAVVELTPDDQVIYSTKGGELADARKMGEQGIYDFLSSKLGAGTAGTGASVAPATTPGGGASASQSGGSEHGLPLSRARFWGWD